MSTSHRCKTSNRITILFLNIFRSLEMTLFYFEETRRPSSQSTYDSSLSAFVFRCHPELSSTSTKYFHSCSSLPSSSLFHSMSSTTNDPITTIVSLFLSIFFLFISIKERKTTRHNNHARSISLVCIHHRCDV